MGLDMAYVLRCGLCAAVLLILSGPPNALSIKCWVCNAVHDPRCNDPFDNKTFAIVDCEQLDYLRNDDHHSGHEHHHPVTTPPVKSTVCLKSSREVNGVVTLVRDCGSPPESHKLSNDTAYCIGSDCYCGNKDGCNGSWQTSPGIYVLGGSLLLGFLIVNLNK